MYSVDVDVAPAYEIIVSLVAYRAEKEHKTLELGPSWAVRVRERLPASVAVDVVAMDAAPLLPLLIPLVWREPCGRDSATFIEWLRTTAVDELVALVAPFMPARDRLTVRELGKQRDRCAHLLGLWHEYYFRHLDPAIMAGLVRDAAEKQHLRATISPRDIVEEATRGIYLEPAPDIDGVLLAPQFHYRPWTVYHCLGRLKIYLYPADPLPPEPGDLPPRLMRMTRALSDESRMRILRFLAGGAYTFTAVVRQTGLAKSTVHQHMGVLRAAGLVRVHDGGDRSGTYSLRPKAVGLLADQLDTFLRADAGTPPGNNSDR